VVVPGTREGAMSSTVVEFLYDFASPNCYVALHKLKEMRRKSGFELRFTPLFLGGLFQMTSDGPVARGTNEYNYMVKNLQRIAEDLGIGFAFPHSNFPVNSVRALRGSYFAESRGKVEEYVARVFHEYWVEGTDISDASALGNIAASLGMTDSDFLEFIGKEETKLRLRRETEAAYQRGVFGSPTYFVNGQMYWGTPEVLWFLAEQRAL